MASYLDTINKLYEIERKRIDPYSSAKKVEAQQTSVVPQLQTSAKSEAASGEKNNGSLLGGLGYLGEKLAVGFMQSVEGIWDFTAGGIADLLGADAWAEEQIATDWFGDWYETAGDWFNAGDGWKTAGDVASGIGTSVIPMAAAMFIPVPGANAALAGLTRFGVSTLAATPAAGGSALREAYAKTGKVDKNTWGYALQSGVTEGALEGVTNVIGIGGGALLKQFGKTAAKNMAKQATKAASMQGVKATLSTIGKTALEGFAGEAFEEGMSTILNPIYARATYDPEAKNATAQEIAYSAWVGGLAGAVMGEGGLIASSALSAKSGSTLVAKNYQNEVLSFAEALISEETKNPTDSAAMKLVNAKKAQLEKSLQDNNGEWGITQKKLLGDLNAASTEAVMDKAVVASALNLINNADAIATELSAYGYTDSNGNPIKITAEQIRAGISGKTKNIAIRKALENNPLLRSLASADAAGRLLMDTDSFAEQARSGKTLRTQDLLDQFIERASDEQKASLGHDLGINNWDGLRVEDFNYLVDKQYDTVGKQFKRARQKQRFEKLRGNKSIAVGKASAYRAKNDGIRKYKVNGHTFAVEKSGDEYTLYDYDNKGVSIELTLDELRKSLAIYDEAQAKLKQSAGKTADASEQAAEQNKASTAEKSSEKAQKEKTVTEKDTGESDNNVKKSFKLAKKVAGYDKLSAPDQRRVRSFIRQGLAFGVKEDVIIAGASISSRTRVEAIFNKAACAIIDENGNLTGYAHGFYNPRTKQFVFNPDAQTTDGILIHELDHAIRKRIGKGNFVTTKIYKGAIEKLNPDTFKKITEKYDKKHEQRGKVPETVTYFRRTSEQKLVDKLVEQKNQEEFAKTAETLIDEYEAHYAQQVLESKGIMQHLVSEKPALKDRILNFLKGAETDYANVPALSKEAAKYYKMYKRWFDSFAKSREGARIGAESDMAIPQNVEDVRYSFSSIVQKFFGDDSMDAETFAKMDYKKTKGYLSYVYECLSNMRQTIPDLDEKSAIESIEKSIDGIVRVAVAAKKAGYDITDTKKKRNTKDSKQRLLFSSLEPNSDYITSHDISTICDKRKTFAEIYDDIVRKEEALGVPNEKRFFSNMSNYFIIHKIMARKGLTAPCRQCYVESMRKNLARMANSFVKLISETDPNNKKNEQLWNVSGKSKGKPKVGNTELREQVLAYLSVNGLTPEYFTVEKLTTAKQLAQMRLDHPRLYEAFNSFYGQSKPKMPKEAVPFRFGELTALLTGNNGKIRKEMVKRINHTGGFRLQSYSDFQIENFVDVLQVIFEAGTLGLNGHAYTKVPAFLDATANTNLKRNISVFMYKDGNQWKIDKADSFHGTMEDIYARVESDKSGDTGIIVVVQNDSNAAWVMANDRVGYGIPFHKSGNTMDTVRSTIVREDGREINGYKDIKDHTKFQSETWKETTIDHKAGTKVKSGISIYEFWDFDNKENLSKKALIKKNLMRYIDECEKLGYRPKFVDYLKGGTILNETLSYAKQMGFVDQNASVSAISFNYKGYVVPYGYYKFLGDFGMFTPDGKASPQKPLSLEHYDFDKAVSFFENAENLRREEILQRFENGKVRDDLRASNKTTAELLDLLNKNKSDIVADVLYGRYGKNADKVFSLPITDEDGNTVKYSEEDLAYESAVQSGDMATAQRMVDEAAKKAGYTTKGYHGTGEDFNVFSEDKVGKRNVWGKGFYFGTSKGIADDYASWRASKGGKYRIVSAYLKFDNPYIPSKSTIGSAEEILDRWFPDMWQTSRKLGVGYINGKLDGAALDLLQFMAEHNGIEVRDVLTEYGYDGVKDGGELVAFSPEQIKSADPVTYDDNGFIIPLSKRFDPTVSDIRFSVDLDENGTQSVDNYTEEQYNSFGWARHAEALTKDELDDLYSKLQEKKILRRFKQSSSGEAIVEVNDKPKTTLGVDNVFVFVKGKATEPQITRVLRVSLFNETDMEKVRKYIYAREKAYSNGRTSKFAGDALWENGLVDEYARRNVQGYQEYRSEIGKRSVGSQSERDSSYDRSRYERDRYTRRSEDDVSYSLPLDDSYVDKSVPYVGEDNMSVGEMRKRIANSTHYKVYSKSRVLNTIKSLPVINSLNGKTVGTLADAMWKSFNTITSTEQADAYVSDMADYIMSVAMSDAKTKRNIPEDSQRRFNMMRGYVQKLVFTEKELDEIKTVRGEKELKRILGRWGYKAKNDANGMKSIKTPVDVFVADISREMSEFSYIEDMNHIDAFFALDEAYTEAKNDVSDKWQSIFEDVSDEDIDSIRYALKDDLMNAFKNAGDKSNYKKILENTVERYKDRADYWKAEYDKENGRSRLTNIVAAKARKLKDLKVHRFANATQFENDTLDAVIAKLARVVINGNVSVKTAKSACEELLMLYRSSTFRKGVLEFYDENNQGYYNELIETYLEILVGEENHLSIEDYVEKGDQYYKGYTKQQLKMLADVMSYFTSLYENYGKVWKNGKLEEAMPLAKQYITGIRETKAIYGERIGNRLTNWYRDTFFDPISVMRRIDGYDDGFFTDIYGEFRRGVIDAEIAKMNIFREYDGWLNSHKKYLANASETAVEFMGHKIPKIKLVDLYCTSKRKQAQAGLAINGFAYDDLKGLVVRVDGKLDKDGKYTEEQIKEVITDMQTEIEKHLTAEDREYISLIEKVYNGEAKRLKTMRDFARQGFTNAEADYYYPIRRAYIKKSVDSATMKEEIDRVSNASFNKDVVKGAKQELTVESADSRFRRHVQAVCQYAYLSPAIDTFNRLYNLDTIGNKDRSVSIRNESENLWRKGMMYFEKLVADIQGINERTEGSEVLSFIRGGYAISVLSVNPKVWVTQLSSFAAASGMIDVDCITKGLTTVTKEDIKNIGRYCPLAELRRYENTAAMAQAVVDNRGVQRGSGSKSVQAMRKLGEAGMKPIEKVDSMVINRLFGACMQQVEKYQGIKIGTEENKIAAGKLLETLILETQQNALATERSAAMRSNNEIFRAATMFSADAMKVVGRFVDATGEARALKARIKNAADAETKTALESRLNEAHKKVRKSLGALIASSAYMAGVTALFKLLYNKWDKEWEKDEEKAHSVGSSIVLDFIGNNFGGLPLIRDVVSKLTEGYDIDNYAYSAINDIVQAAQNLANLASSDTSSEDVANAIKNLVYATSSFTGLPARNVYNVVYGLTKRVSEPAAYKIDEVFYEKNYASDLQKYIDEGDVTMSDFIIDLIYDTRVGDTVKESTMKKIRSLANKGYKVIPREIKATVTVDGNEYTLTEKEQEDVREKYFDYLSALDRLCEGAMYSALDEEKKYQAIKNVIDIGYEKALSDILGTECSRGTLLSYCIGVESFATVKAIVKDVDNDVDNKGNVIEGSKRENVVKAIRSMPANATQKVLMMYALGYTPKDNEVGGMTTENAKKRLLSSIVNATDLTKAQKEQLAAACGFTVKNGKIVP